SKKPEWATGDVVEQIQRSLASAPVRSFFDPDLPRDLRRAIGGHPWVKEINGVDRRFPDRVVVSARPRKPSAAVPLARAPGRGAGGFGLMDAEGFVLETGVASLDAWSRRLGRRLLLITGSDARSPLRPGSCVADPAVAEGAAIARDLEGFAATDVGREIALAAV